MKSNPRIEAAKQYITVQEIIDALLDARPVSGGMSGSDEERAWHSARTALHELQELLHAKMGTPRSSSSGTAHADG